MENKYGLTSEEVKLSKEKYGTNSLTEQKREGFFAKLIGNFGDPMIIILCVALVINVTFAILGACGVIQPIVKWYESVGIAAAVLIATLVSTFSEYKNENTFAKLQADASRIVCKVYRDGSITEVFIDELVIGDCVILQTGDKIPADGILVDGSVQVDQSVLNGESKEATKIVAPDDYVEAEKVDFLDQYRLFRGSVVCSGNAVMKITVIGDKTVYGGIAGELQTDDDRETPLKLKLGKLAKQISVFGYVGGLAIAIAFLFDIVFIRNGFDWGVIGQTFFATGDAWAFFFSQVVEAVMLAVIIIVMAVPEGLPLMIAIVSSQNMRKMLKDNVLVRKISGIETAGSLNVLFTDKTGTITKGMLEAVVFIDGTGKEYAKYDELSKPLSESLLLNAVYNSTVVIGKENDKIVYLGGNATERALLSFAGAKGKTDDIKVENSIIFTSLNKYSAVTVSGTKNITYIKGAPEKIGVKCKYYYDEEGNKKEISVNEQILTDKINELAKKSIRVIALAACEEAIKDDKLPEEDWTLIGYVGIRDDIRPDVIPAIKEVHRAGIQIVMITGDRKETATAIALESGIIENESDLVITSDELAAMTDEEVKEKLSSLRVVARALPSDKSRLVKLAQELNLVAGMTGDGVNDSPALKKSDVGFAMGGGTEVAKEASEIVILDDNFNSIEKAVLYGRTIFNSIRRFIIFQLTINVGAVLISFICPLLRVENPLTITQILWVNLVMDTLAALAFGGEPALKEYMDSKPKSRDEQIVSKNMWSAILLGSIWTFTFGMIMLFVPGFKAFFGEHLLTAYFTYFIFSAIFNAFNARTDSINLFKNIILNKGFLIVMGAISVVQLLLTYFGGVIFNCNGLEFVQLLVVLALAITIIPVDICRKSIIKIINNKNN